MSSQQSLYASIDACRITCPSSSRSARLLRDVPRDAPFATMPDRQRIGACVERRIAGVDVRARDRRDDTRCVA